MKILALPRDPGNPYQELLYRELIARGVRVAYAGELTRSQTANILLLPLELIVRRALGWRLIHIHWVYTFQFFGAQRHPWLRRAAQACFVALLATARLVGMRIVWTAHNVLPHEQVFHDDAAARRALVRASDLVLAHSRATLKALDGIGARPRRVVIVPHGRYEIAGDREQLRMPGSGKSPRRLLFLGLMRAYKGVEELISAVAGLDPDVCVQVDIVGECPDDELRLRLERLARDAGERVRLRFGWVSDAEVTPLIATSDAAVMPFRAATTSGSALLMMSHGRPIIVPPLPAFDDMAAEALIRYDGSTSDLRRAIRDVVRAKPGALAEAGDAASSYASSLTWDNAAERTLVAFTALEGP